MWALLRTDDGKLTITALQPDEFPDGVHGAFKVLSEAHELLVRELRANLRVRKQLGLVDEP